MNWILGIIGAVFGGALMAAEESLGGMVLGFFVMFVFGSLMTVRARLEVAERELQKLRAQPRPAPAPVVSPWVAAAGTEAASSPAPASPATPTREAAPAPYQQVTDPAAPRPRAVPPPLKPIAPAASAAAPPPREPVDPAAAAAAAAARAAHAERLRAAREPDFAERAVNAVKAWFTEGNVPVKIGVLVLFAGVAAALRYAAAQGYFTLPLEYRYAAFAAAGLAALAFGWRERLRKPAFGLSLQGGAIGVLLLTVFAAYRLYPIQAGLPGVPAEPLLPAGMAFALIVVLVAGSALLALLQNAMWLAVLGFLGGYLAPVLISTGSGNHVALFSYYAVLNAAVFLVSWKRAWRLLNLIGFAFTFGVGTAWGLKYYQPHMFATVEPFLILFFAFYVVIGLLYVLRQTEHRKPWVDGTLVFGTPLLAFPLQAGLLKDDRIGLAFSALVVAGVYLGLLAFLRKRKGERLLTEAYGALAIGFATLAVPLAFSASTTGALWALEGAGIAWLGIRQNRWFPWFAGLALQGLAAIAYLIGFFDHPNPAPDALLLLNPHWLGAAILAFAAFALSLIHERHRNVVGLPALLFGVGVFWWAWGGLGQMDQASATIGTWQFGILYLAVSAAAAALLRKTLDWDRLNWMLALIGPAGLAMVFVANDEFGAPLRVPALLGWAVYFAAMAYALWMARESERRSPAIAHLAVLWTVPLALSLQLLDQAQANALGNGWQFLAVVAPLAMQTLLTWRKPDVFAWPRAEAFADYRVGWFAPAFVLLMLAWVVGLFAEGSSAPLVTLPLLNPLELSLIAIFALVFGYTRSRGNGYEQLRKVAPFAAFAFVTLTTLRAVHHLHGEPWGPAVLDSAFSQAALTIVWSLIGVSAWILGSRRADRGLWMAGAVLMGVVLLKLMLVDRRNMDDMAGWVSVLAVGLLLVGVGWIAPSPPRQPTADAPEAP